MDSQLEIVNMLIEEGKSYTFDNFCLPRSDYSGQFGGYDTPEAEDDDSSQFDVSDKRTLDEVIKWLMELGYIPSFCTACYRAGRTGDRFMQLCKTKQIQNCCHPNALMTLEEYLVDYASAVTKKMGDGMILKETENIPNEKNKRYFKEKS
jgi:2-iminoacetate synthase